MSISNSVISSDCTLRGDLHSSGDVVVEGRVEGNIEAAGAVVVAERAVVTHAIVARAVRVEGTVEGTVHARERVLVGPRGRLLGSVQGALSIEPGGFVPAHQASPRRRPVTPVRVYDAAPPRAPSTGALRSITDADIHDALFLRPEERPQRTAATPAATSGRRLRPPARRRGGTNPGVRPPGGTITPETVPALSTGIIRAALAERDPAAKDTGERPKLKRSTAPGALVDAWFQEDDAP